MAAHSARCHTYSDFLEAYQKVLPKETHRAMWVRARQTMWNVEQYASAAISALIVTIVSGWQLSVKIESPPK
jgi:hypothetical protein